MPASYPVWDSAATTPKINLHASVMSYRMVQNTVVIKVENATYRDSQPLSGFFELVDPDKEPRKLRGEMRAEVYCAWHGVRPPTVFPRIIVGNNWKIHSAFSGKVIDNIAS